MIFVRSLSERQIQPSRDRLVFHVDSQDWYIVDSKDEYGQRIDPVSSRMILAAQDYLPAWELACEDVSFFLNRNSSIAKSSTQTLRALLCAVNFHLRNQPQDNFRYLERLGQPASFFWVVGYHNGILYLDDGSVYRCEPEEFQLDKAAATTLFPETPPHYFDPRGLSRDYVPPSLLEFIRKET